MQLSRTLDRFNEPETLKMAKLCRSLRAQGLDITDLSLGEPDFDTPTHIKDAAKKALDENWTHYTPVAGFLDLREAICYKFKRDNNLDYTADQIVVSTGAKQAIANAMISIIDKGDEVIIPTPYWVTYSELVKLAEGTVKFINARLENGYKINAEDLEAAITDKTRLFIFSSPCNPTGAVYSEEELRSLAAVFARHPQVFIISDEIYEYINYVGNHASIASFPEIKDRVIVVNGFSKGFAMTGWRLGYVAAHPDVAKACEKVQGQFTSGPNSITQRAAITALRADLTTTQAMVKEFTSRKKRVMELVSEIPGTRCSEPDGAFYVFPEISSYFGKSYEGQTINTAEDLCMYLVNHAHVSTVTGKAFGEENCIRISFANSLANIEEGFKRIKVALAELK
jgi:aspartate aminotransferase